MNPNISLAKILQTSTRPDSNDIAKSVTHSHNHISPGGWGHRRRRHHHQDKRTQQLYCKSEKLIALRDELLRWESSTGYASTASCWLAGWLLESGGLLDTYGWRKFGSVVAGCCSLVRSFQHNCCSLGWKRTWQQPLERTRKCRKYRFLIAIPFLGNGSVLMCEVASKSSYSPNVCYIL